MLSLSHIWTVARVEVKTVLRSWFFRIFAGLSIASVLLLNIHLLIRSFVVLSAKHLIAFRAPWANRAIPSSIPYLTIMILNVLQGVIAIFLASDFVKQDRRLDSTEAVYARPISNRDYILGKILGICFVFLVLNIISLLVAIICNFFFSDVPVAFKAYIFYPILISIPALLYILGLSSLLMVGIRSQAITFVVMLGYVVSTVFFLSSGYYNLFDYMALKLPLLNSGFIGFGNTAIILMQRGMYVFLGLSFISFTVAFMKRLPQSRIVTVLSRIMAILFLLSGVILGTVYVTRASEGMYLRRRMVELNNSLVRTPWVTPLRYDIDLAHEGEEITTEVKLLVRNDTSRPIDRYLLNLNPSLIVDDVKGARGKLIFERNLHILAIEPSRPLLPGSIDSFIVSYHGSINDDACYLDVDEESREKPFQVGCHDLIKVDKRHAFITPHFLLLTPENLWYPVPGLQFNSLHPQLRSWNFAVFNLRVKTKEGLDVVSQGMMEKSGKGEYIFKPEFPLPGVSLVIGDYERQSVTVDSVEYNLFIRTGHDCFSQYFDELGDTVSVLIRELKQGYESKLQLPYLYRRFTLVEVPVQFHSYQRMFWTKFKETVQPEIILAPEKGYMWNQAECLYLKRLKRGEVQSQRTTEENQSNWFKVMFNIHLLSGFDYHIFPNYFTFTYHVESERWPVLNTILESYLFERLRVFKQSRHSPLRSTGPLSSAQLTSMALQESSFSEVLRDPKSRPIIQWVLHYKGTYLFMLLESMIGAEPFNEFLAQILDENRFCKISEERFSNELMKRYQFDLDRQVETWYRGRHLPGFLFKDFRAYQVLDDEKIRYQYRFKVYNPEPVEGLIFVRFFEGYRSGGTAGSSRYEGRSGRIIHLAANQAKEVGIVVDSQEKAIVINTLISKNLPDHHWETFEEFDLDENSIPFDGERILQDGFVFHDTNEVIVDNEDPGFELTRASAKTFFQRIWQRSSIDGDTKYTRTWRRKSPQDWQFDLNEDYYGRYIRSACLVSSGKGNKKATWNATIPENGYYDVYCYTIGKRYLEHAVLSEMYLELQSPVPIDKKVDIGSYRYKVYHDEGIDNVTLDMNSAQYGWNFLGMYYFSKGNVKVELTNECDAKLVLADAVKWVKR